MPLLSFDSVLRLRRLREIAERAQRVELRSRARIPAGRKAASREGTSARTPGAFDYLKTSCAQDECPSGFRERGERRRRIRRWDACVAIDAGGHQRTSPQARVSQP